VPRLEGADHQVEEGRLRELARERKAGSPLQEEVGERALRELPTEVAEVRVEAPVRAATRSTEFCRNRSIF